MKLVQLLLVTVMLISFATSCSAPSAEVVFYDSEETAAKSAMEVMNRLSASELPIGEYIEYDELNDPNGIMNKEGAYIQKIDFEILGVNQPVSGNPSGGSIEFFSSAEEAIARKQKIGSYGFLGKEHSYVIDTFLLRIDKSLSEEEANSYLEVARSAIQSGTTSMEEAVIEPENSFDSGIVSVLRFQDELELGELSGAEIAGSLAAFKINLMLYEGLEKKIYFYCVYGKADYVEEYGIEDIEEVRDYISNIYEAYMGGGDISRYDKIEEDRAERAQKEKEQYIASASSVSYESLIREPYNYEGAIIKVTVTISQTMSGGFLTESGYRGYESGTSGEWYISYELPSNTPRILSGDTITFYGEFAGLIELSRVTGAKDEVPRIKALYHE